MVRTTACSELEKKKKKWYYKYLCMNATSRKLLFDSRFIFERGMHRIVVTFERK